MAAGDETRDDTLRDLAGARVELSPALVVLFAAGQPSTRALRLDAEGVVLGREPHDGVLAQDERASRMHARIRHDGAQFCIEDLGSRNGTFVDGKKLEGELRRPGSALVRIGRSLLWTVNDASVFLGTRPASIDGGQSVLGGRLRRAYGEIALASKTGDTLYVCGESGSGKELAARAFHAAHFGADAQAPFVAVNCAAIPEGLAESLLFGARKGAYSGATADSEGYLQAADGGTLFLDEIAELDPLVQGKLLRVLENREVTPLGAARARKVSLRICAASHKNLRDEVENGRFREDLYFRLGRPEVQLPPLRERLDELPWHIARELARVSATLSASVAFVEACALRPWPGNVRELLGELRRAAHRALDEKTNVLEPSHLAPEAGMPLSMGGIAKALRGGAMSMGGIAPALRGGAMSDAVQKSAAARSVVRADAHGDETIEKALAEHGGNVRGAARALGMHRNQLRRWLEKRERGTPNEPDRES